jgi:hypothetical protein
MKKTYMWSRVYADAMVETDSQQLPRRIRAAEWAIQERLSSSLPVDPIEKGVMTEATARLKSLKTGTHS